MRNSRSQFFSLLLFSVALVLLLTNAFIPRIAAQNQGVDVISEIAPIGEVLDEILKNYVREPEPKAIVEGALEGMMNSLDEHSSFVSAAHFKQMTEDTVGEFEGIGVSIQFDEDKNIRIHHPISGSPAHQAGLLGGDIIIRIDGVPAKGMSLQDAADRIRGPKGTVVKIGVIRTYEDSEDVEPEVLEFDITRGKIPLESLEESRLLEDGIGYVRVSDFKKRTAEEIGDIVKGFQEKGMRSLILDLRWNPGGLLTSSKEVCELFLPRDTLVTYTMARDPSTGELAEDMRLFTSRDPVIPQTVPLIVLVNEHTASSSEIVTGALQYWSRALILGEKTYGKGSVQTLIELKNPPDSALRLTTGLYYTPGDVTIDKQGIIPDIEVPMKKADWVKLLIQMADSYRTSPDPEMKNRQNHGTVTGNEVTGEIVEDVQLQRAVELMKEEGVFEKLIAKYHRDVKETQMTATQAAENHSAAAGDQEQQQSGASEEELEVSPEDSAGEEPAGEPVQ